MGGPEMAPHTPPPASRSSQGLDRPRDAAPVITEIDIHVDANALRGLERDVLVLTAEERRWGRRRVKTAAGRELILALPTGTALTPGHVLHRDTDWYVVIDAAAEPVLAITPRSRDEALRVAFEVGKDRKSTRLNSKSLTNLVCRLLLEKKKKKTRIN